MVRRTMTLAAASPILPLAEKAIIMARIVRHEFLGNWFLFWLLCATGVLIPVALLYLINGTIQVETEMKEPEEFVAAYRAGKIKRR